MKNCVILAENLLIKQCHNTTGLVSHIFILNIEYYTVNSEHNVILKLNSTQNLLY